MDEYGMWGNQLNQAWNIWKIWFWQNARYTWKIACSDPMNSAKKSYEWNHQITMGFPRNPMKNHHEIPWNPVKITVKSHEIRWKSPWNHHEITMKSPWNPLRTVFSGNFAASKVTITGWPLKCCPRAPVTAASFRTPFGKNRWALSG